ncbi:MAG: hypothetical protein WBM71_13630 [Sedimenticolaceae bacterium]
MGKFMRDDTATFSMTRLELPRRKYELRSRRVSLGPEVLSRLRFSMDTDSTQVAPEQTTPTLDQVSGQRITMLR